MENTTYISDLHADDLFIMNDILEDCTELPPDPPSNPNFPDIDFDEWEDYPEGHIPPDFPEEYYEATPDDEAPQFPEEDYPEGDPWQDGEPCLTPTWLD